MATINNTMTLNDQVSPAFSRMIKQMERTLTMFNQLNRSIGGATNTSSLDRASSSISRMGNSTRAVRRGMDDTANATRRVTNATSQSTSAVNNTNNATSRLKNLMQQAGTQANNVKTRLSSISFMNIYYGVQMFKSLVDSVSRVTDKLDDMGLTMARLETIKDDLQTVEELNQKIFDSANRTGQAYSDVQKAVAKLRTVAPDAFNTNDEAIAFTELLSKIGKVSGASSQEISAGIYQINQALAAGALQGDEFRSVAENFPMYANLLSETLGKSRAELKKMGAEGKITADVMTKALFNNAEKINEMYSKLPRTFAQQIQTAKNYAMQSLQPLADTFSKFINSSEGIKFFENVGEILVNLTKIAMVAFKLFVLLFNFINENLWLLATTVGSVALIWFSSWVLANIPLLSTIATIGLVLFVLHTLGLSAKEILGLIAIALIIVAMYFAYLGLTALWAGTQAMIAWLNTLFPLWLVVAVVFIIIAAFNMLGLTVGDAIGFIIGILFILIAVIINVGIFFYNIFGEVAVFLENLFINPINAIIMLFYGLAESCLEALRWVIQGLEDLLNLLPGVEVDFTSTIDRMINSVRELKKELADTGLKQFEQKGLIEFKTAYNKGSNIMQKSPGGKGGAKNPFTGKGAGTLGGLKIPTGAPKLGAGKGKNGKLKGGKLDKIGKIEEDVTITDEDIKMLKDIAATDFINSYTTLRPDMKVEFTGPINETADIDKILGAIEDMAEDALSHVLLEEVG